MRKTYDTNAPKRRVTLSLNADFLERQTKVREMEAEALRRAARAWNDFVEQHRALGDEFTTL